MQRGAISSEGTRIGRKKKALVSAAPVLPSDRRGGMITKEEAAGGKRE